MPDLTICKRGLLVALLSASGCHSGQWESDTLAYRQPGGALTPIAITRPRYTYTPVEIMARLSASSVRVEILDDRPTNERPEPSPTSSPTALRNLEISPALAERAQARLQTLISSDGPALRVVGRIERLALRFADSKSVLGALVVWSISTEAQGDVWKRTSVAGFAWTGTPLDEAEVAELSVGAVLSSLDQLLTEPGIFDEINRATTVHTGVVSTAL